MIKLVVIKNPFNLHDKDIKQLEYISIKNINGYIQDSRLTDDVKVSINGKLIEDSIYSETYLKDGDIICICPVIEGGGGDGGKSVLGMIAAVALCVVAIGVGGAVSGLGFGAGVAGMTSWTMAGYIAAAAVMYMGGTLMQNFNSAVSIDTDFSMDNFKTSSTYSWNGGSTHISQGSPIPITYGKVKITNNNVLSAHTISNGEKQYLNLLISSGEGEIDSISDVKIDDNPISNYNEVQFDYRLGTNDQKPISIPNFNDNYSDVSLSYELTTADWKTQRVEGNSTQGLEITIEFPAGLYFANDSGGLSNTGVGFICEYKEINNKSWSVLVNTRIDAATSSVVRRIYRTSVSIGTYDIRCRLTYKDNEGSRYSNRCKWTQVSSIIPENFSYPNMVLVAIKALATSQLSGSAPQVTWIQERKNVLVYNPYTKQYEAQRANNPAWACYDILHLAKKIGSV